MCTVHSCVLVSTVDPVHAPHDPTRTSRQVSRCFYRGVVLFNHSVPRSGCVLVAQTLRHLMLVLCRLTFTRLASIAHIPPVHGCSLRAREGRLGCHGESVNSWTVDGHLAKVTGNRQTFAKGRYADFRQVSHSHNCELKIILTEKRLQICENLA